MRLVKNSEIELESWKLRATFGKDIKGLVCAKDDSLPITRRCKERFYFSGVGCYWDIDIRGQQDRFVTVNAVANRDITAYAQI
jgi:hypothetical protein